MLTTAITGALSALLLSLILTPFIAWSSRRYGYVAYPRGDRWHQQPTAIFGGVGIFLSFLIPFAFFYDQDRTVLFVLLGGTIIFGLGVLDDLRHLQPYTKLVVQIVAASLVTFESLEVSSPALALIVFPIAVLWLVALTNAFNLLDNMDGLSAGTACIASFFLFVISSTLNNRTVSLCAALLFGATLGFLFYNFHPARIFMGDSGSMFLGFVLASLAMKGNWEQTSNLLLPMLTPVLVLAVPIFDTTFVTLMRWMNNRAISQGGRDHTSHRLVTFGLSEKKTVLLFYLFSLVCGSIAFLGVWYNALLLSVLGTSIVIVGFYFGMFLSGIVVYGTESEVKPPVTSDQPTSDRGVVLDIVLTHKRRILEILVDVVLICVAYSLSFVVKFDGYVPQQYFRVLAQSMPLILPMKLLVFASFGLYRGVWRYVGMRDLIAIFNAVTLSSMLVTVAMMFIVQFPPFPRSIFVIDWMALLLLIAGARVLIHVIREYLLSLSDPKGKRVAIVGAGDAGELVLREIKTNTKLGYVPVGFFDDDPNKHGRRIHGVPVIGGRDRIPEMVAKLCVEQIIVAIPSVPVKVLEDLIAICESTGLPVTVMPLLADLIQKGLLINTLKEPWNTRTQTPNLGQETAWN